MKNLIGVITSIVWSVVIFKNKNFLHDRLLLRASQC